MTFSLSEIAEVLSGLGLKDSDYLTVDYFLYRVAEMHKQDSTKEQSEVNLEDFDHDQVKDYIRDIGLLLGFDAVTEETIAPGARVDDVWTSRVGNLGIIKYVFEVQSKGNIDSLILNLQKAKSSPLVQKVIAVSDEGQLNKIQKEVESLGEFKKYLVCWRAQDVIQTYENLSQALKLMEALGLSRTS